MSSKSRKKNKERKRFRQKTRKRDAIKWLLNIKIPDDLIHSYSKRYGCSMVDAQTELMEIGYYDEIYIQSYEKNGIEWEYRLEPQSGEMVVVPKDSEEYEIYQIHDLFGSIEPEN